MALKFFGHLGYGDMQTPFSSLTVQVEFLNATRDLLAEYRAETDQIFNLFVERDTEEPQLRYGQDEHGGIFQRLGGHDQPKSMKGALDYTVGFPLQLYGEKISDNRREVAKLTVERYDRLVAGLLKRHSAMLRYEMFRRIFNNTNEVYNDLEFGNVTVQPLANGDTIKYPLGLSPTLQTFNAYIPTNFAAIADATNPYALIKAKWDQLFPDETAGGNGVTYINSAQEAATMALAAFTELPDPNVRFGANADQLINRPGLPPTARLIGRTNGQWVAVWDSVVDPTYMLAMHPNLNAPLIRRVERARYGLPRGLSLVADTDANDNWPWHSQIFEDSLGFGVGNRLGALVVQLVASSTYTIPTRYAY